MCDSCIASIPAMRKVRVFYHGRNHAWFYSVAWHQITLHRLSLRVSLAPFT